MEHSKSKLLWFWQMRNVTGFVAIHQTRVWGSKPAGPGKVLHTCPCFSNTLPIPAQQAEQMLCQGQLISTEVVPS